jgi:hypothetical protein
MAAGQLEANLDNLARILRQCKCPPERHDRIGYGSHRLEETKFYPIFSFFDKLDERTFKYYDGVEFVETVDCCIAG